MLLSLALPAALMAQLDQAWVATYNGPYPKNSIDQGTCIAVDAAGNTYVAGNSDVGYPNGAEYAVIKYDPSGNQVWVGMYDFVPGYNTLGCVNALAVDATGNVYVTGYTALDATGGYGTVKFNSSGVVEWARTYKGPGSSYDWPRVIAVDGAGNVFVTGYGPGSGTGNDWATVKYDANGNQLWVVRYDGPTHGSDVAAHAMVDAAGNLYVTGGNSSGTGGDCVTIKYDTNGNQVWLATYDGPANGSDYGTGIRLDASGNVFVTGSSAGGGTNADYLTLKYDPTGTQVWVTRYNNPPTNGNDYGSDIALDAAGNVYVTGYSAGTGTGDDFATVKYDASGNQLWVARYNNPSMNGTDRGYSVGVDAAGNVYVGGTSRGATSGDDYATVKYNSSGTEQWVARYNGPGNGSEYLNGLALDAAGNIHVTGGSYGLGNSPDFATIEYSPSGAESWVARYDYPLPSAEYGQKVAMDAAGNVYVTGNCTDPYSSSDYATIKYDAAGNQVWFAQYNGPGNSTDNGYAVTVDGSGNVYVTGLSGGPNNSPDYATIKYDAAGNQLWVARYDGPNNGLDWANSIAVDALGNVYVTGYSVGNMTSTDYATAKYDGTDGTELWVARYNGPGNGPDQASALALDAAGNVYVTGYSNGGSSGNDYLTVKYNPQGDTVWTRRYKGPAGKADQASAIAVDATGNVCVTGYSAGSTTGNDYLTVKYNPQGDTVWTRRYNWPGSGADQAVAIALDAAGNVCVTGYSAGTGTGNDYATVKYNTDGIQQWVARYTGPGNGQDAANGIGVDAAGNVYVTGNSLVASPGPWNNADCVTIMYGPDGHQMALAQYDGAGAPDLPRAIAVSPGGTACITGYSYVLYENIDILTIKYFVPYGWTSRTMLPTGPSERYEGAGGWLSYNAADKLIYAAKGENTADFYSFNPGTNAWTDLVPIPLGTELKLPHDGCRGVTDGADKVYMTKGANTLGFWSYTISTKTWTQLADVPAGRQKVKGGTDLAYVVIDRVGYVYLLKGQEREFYRYNTATNAWERLADAPSGNWLAGSWLVFDGDHSLYAHKALSREMYRFDVTTGAWGTAVLTGMPPGNSNLQLGTGGSATWLYGSIYTLKGNNTAELWRYDPGADQWTALDDVPPDKRVHMGGDITATPDVIFAFKGAKTKELWRYVPYPGFGEGSQMAGNTRLGSKYALSVAPNPMRLGAAISYALPTAGNVSLKLYDVTGALAKTVASGPVQAGRYTTKLSAEGLARGVYVLKLATDAGSVTRKIVIE